MKAARHGVVQELARKVLDHGVCQMVKATPWYLLLAVCAY